MAARDEVDREDLIQQRRDAIRKAAAAAAPTRPTTTPYTSSTMNAMKPAAAPVKNIAAFSYQTPRYTGPTSLNYNIPNAPSFYAAPYLLPNPQDTFNDPSYQFRLNEGLKALERSAAAKGTLRTGNTLEDLMRYGQDYASQEYGNAVNRGLQQYQTNLGTSQLMYAPGYATWQARAEAEKAAKDAAYQRAWQMYTFPIEDERAREEMLLNASLRYL